MRALSAAVAFLLILLMAGPAAAGEREPSARALDWIVPRLTEDPSPGSVVDMSSTGKRISAKAVSAYLLLLHPEEKQHQAAAKRIEADLCRFVLHDPGFSQETWLLGFISLWLAEKKLRGEVSEDLFTELVYRIEDGQNREGGWAHGLPLGLRFYPTTLVAATNWSLLGLGLSRRLGSEVDEDVVGKGLGLYRRVQGETGAFPYGGPNYRKGHEAGRTTGAVVALAALGETSSPLFSRAAAYVLRQPRAVPRGHASPAMHILTGALAFHILGDEAWSRYDEAVLREIRPLQQEDGSFRCLIPDCPDCMGLIGSKELSTLYISACYAAALATERSKVAALLRSPVPVGDRVPSSQLSQLPVAWEREVAHVRHLALASDRLLTVDDGGRLQAFDAASGEPLYTIIPPAAGEGRREDHGLAVAGDRMIVWTRSLPVGGEGAFDSATPLRSLRQTRGEVRETLVCRSIVDGSESWKAEVPGTGAGYGIGAGRLCTQVRRGALVVRDLEDGTCLFEVDTDVPMVNSSLDVAEDGCVAVAAESRVRVFGPDGEERWSRSARGRRGINPPAHGAVAWAGGRLAAGRSDGAVLLLAGKDGEEVWSTTVGSAVVALLVSRDGKGLFVLDSESVLRRLDVADGSLVWRFSPPRRREHAHPVVPHEVAEGVLLVSPGDERIFLLDTATGEVKAVVDASAAVTAGAGDGRVFLVEQDRIRAFDLP